MSARPPLLVLILALLCLCTCAVAACALYETRPNAHLLTFFHLASRRRCYEAATAKELDGVMASNAKGIATGQKEASGTTTGKERRAATWGALFEGLEKDIKA